MINEKKMLTPCDYLPAYINYACTHLSCPDQSSPKNPIPCAETERGCSHANLKINDSIIWDMRWKYKGSKTFSGKY